MDLMTSMILGGGIFVVLALFVFAFSGPNTARSASRRLTVVQQRSATATMNQMMEAQMRRITNGKKSSRMEDVASRFIPRPALLRIRLSKTGKTWTVGQYAMVAILIWLVVSGALMWVGAPLLLALFAGLFVGAGIPHMAVGFLIKRRINKFTVKFPDAIELLVRGLRSGLPIGETIGVVGSEVPGPVGVEFRAVADKMKIGKTMDQALQETSDRLGTPEFQFFCISIAIQRETGGNLAETLANLATVLRQRSQMKLKIKAMSSESKASAYIVGSLPFIVFVLIWFINSHYMQNFFVDPRLMVAGGGGLLWMGIGAFIMAKMVNFEI